MDPKQFDSILMLWTGAYLGAAFFLMAGLLPHGTVSIGLLAQLSWLALLGSIPTTLALAAALALLLEAAVSLPGPPPRHCPTTTVTCPSHLRHINRSRSKSLDTNP